MWNTVDRKRPIRTMWAKTIFVLLTVLLAHSAVQGKKKSAGVAHYMCPLDDNTSNPTHLSVQGDCTRFMKCSYGIAYTLSCPNGQHWSASLDRCEAREVAQCDASATTPKHVVGAGCDFEVKRHSTDCKKFIQCISGQEIVVECLPDMFWNEEKLRCDFDDSSC